MESSDSDARLQIDKERLIGWHNDVRQAGMENKHNLSAADKAITEISILTGHRVERAEVGSPGEFDRLSDDELLTALRERFARLFGETQPLAVSDGAILLTGGTLKDRDR